MGLINYTIDTTKIGKHLMPPFLRMPNMLAMVRVWLAEVGFVNNEFTAYVAAKRLELSYDGRTIVLQKALNDKYPGAGGLILIDNSSTRVSADFVFFNAEGEGDDGFVYFQSEGHGDAGFKYFQAEDSGYDFRVKVPVAFVFDINEMTGFVNLYKAAGKRFVVVTY